MIRKKSCWERVPQSSSWEETVQLELTSHQRNMMGMNVVHYNACDMAGLNPEG